MTIICLVRRPINQQRKKMMKNYKGIIAIALSSAFISGCSQKVWINPSVSNQQAQKDFAECKYDTVKYDTPYNGVSDPIAAGIASGFRQNEIMSTCMTAKGYRLTSQDNAKTSTDYEPNKTYSGLDSSAQIQCITDSDCQTGKKCRSKSGGGNECRVSNEEIKTTPNEPGKFTWKN